MVFGTGTTPSPPTKGQLYGTKWQKARAGYLAKHPFCVMCAAQGKRVLATVVDHIKPHRKDAALFWDKSNWQAICDTHHNSTKQREEKSDKVLGCDKNGKPLDPKHPWNKAENEDEDGE